MVRYFVFKVQEAEHRLQTIVRRIGQFLFRKLYRVYAFIVKVIQVTFFTRGLDETGIECDVMGNHNPIANEGCEVFNCCLKPYSISLQQGIRDARKLGNLLWYVLS